MLSRCCERNGTLAVWDLSGTATPKKALAVIEDLPCKYLQTQINWSPDETLILTGAQLVPPNLHFPTASLLAPLSLQFRSLPPVCSAKRWSS